MACFPKIDQPCPLDRDAQRRVAGHCGRCNKTVHALDSMDGTQRSALLRNAAGPLCVSYRLPLGLGAALALSMAGSVLAAGTEGTPTPFTPVDAQGSLSANGAMSTADPDDAVELEGFDGFFLGGVSDPNEAAWIDDSSLPELPILHELAPRKD